MIWKTQVICDIFANKWIKLKIPKEKLQRCISSDLIWSAQSDLKLFLRYQLGLTRQCMHDTGLISFISNPEHFSSSINRIFKKQHTSPVPFHKSDNPAKGNHQNNKYFNALLLYCIIQSMLFSRLGHIWEWTGTLLPCCGWLDDFCDGFPNICELMRISCGGWGAAHSDQVLSTSVISSYPVW